MRELVTPFLYRTVFLDGVDSAIGFHTTVKGLPSLFGYTRILAMRGIVAEQVSLHVADIVSLGTSLAAVQITNLQFSFDISTTQGIWVLLSERPPPQLGFRRPDISPYRILEAAARFETIGSHLEHLHLAYSLGAFSWLTPSPESAVAPLVRLDRLSLAIDLDRRDVNNPPAANDKLCRNVLPFLHCCRGIPQLAQLRIFFYPLNIARGVLAGGKFLSTVRAMADIRYRISIVAIQTQSEEDLFMRDVHGEVDMWTFGDDYMDPRFYPDRYISLA